ncbi:acetyl/propionyl/methylcrotonyl-CoA carboxylase subunit alpha [Nocardioides perillae]|uniref:3-methylcrotonyl-CoA carboxylase alpha subunit/acetyl-CoA/propionyl-CoA carboxylase biotin carboxyl carrier protein n=1 Tax=Nocardioides perillae TaxID=1119534 RepID=A0A7Y9RSV3_9ACTN|nr:biotin carboxylase N-terminal domain-containing protein [Nocardioides perillae]NYG54273.1 3-methylcrotonyl-CoA carboxylase alpha subunit/acetyl-CoA/propionyl-CoA carboxylase biotin carboxyl carrier protein [Nocardioides perillae]
MFDTVLIANRGEIAVRVARTCARLGIRAVAVATDLDADAPHVRACDAVVRVPSYLDVDAVVGAARASRAQAVHPGYGFLSERAPFARALEAAGIALVGPSADVMDAMGRKDAARDIAVAAGVPVVPSYSLDDDPATFAYPVLVKAAAGGGGKGMRVVRSEAEYAAARDAAAREAVSAFGDGTLLVEKYVERGRHVEVQVMADTHGTVLHLHERDCSAQRRHQKVLEEAPAPGLTDEQRRGVLDAAVALAAHVGYTGAGTVEFLLDEASGEAYFLEMNTRLQVEHPVTEAVTGLDLVELQLRVAAGEPLGLTQADVGAPRGHAIEARVYAEDAYAGFLPQAGQASIVRWPTGLGVRVDHALEDGQVVSTSYDPMLGKVVAHGPDREAARRALVRALDETAVLGLTTNTGFLRELTASEAFTAGPVDTAWLDRVDVAAELTPADADTARVVAAWTQAMLTALASPAGDPFAADGFRLGADPAPQLVELDRPVVVHRAPGGLAGSVDGLAVRQREAARHVVVLDVDHDGATRRHRAVVDATAHRVEVVLRGQRHVFTRPDVLADHGPVAGDGAVLSPMPGTVLDVRVAEGQAVSAGDTLGLVEAMKMELTLTAPFDGTVTHVGAAPGDQVALGHPLFTVEPEPESEPRPEEAAS